jgi:hypothetical protein
MENKATIWGDIYRVIAWLVGIISFIWIWIYSLSVWGLFGIMFGWIPALIGGVVIGLTWPALAILFLIFLALCGIRWPLGVLIIGGIIYWDFNR